MAKLRTRLKENFNFLLPTLAFLNFVPSFSPNPPFKYVLAKKNLTSKNLHTCDEALWYSFNINKRPMEWTPPLAGKATGAGLPGSKNYFLPYLLALFILFPKWAHLPINSQRLLRYDSTKLGHFRPFSSICI